jgi:6-pyruvoyltetrahydropterin/6-carboxytetrahydropterin synthase
MNDRWHVASCLRGCRDCVVYLITKRFRFSASHILSNLPAGHPCSRLHGHNYVVELVLGAPQLDEMGFVVDYRRLDPFKQYLNEVLDHRHLNDVLPIQPSAELIASRLYAWCVENMEHSIVDRLVAVRVCESPNTAAEYRRA